MDENHFKESEKTWDKISDSFDKTRRKPWQICLDYIKIQSKNDIFADFGCGNGRHLIPAARYFKKVIGIDLSNKLLDIVKEKLKMNEIENVELIHSNLINIPIEDQQIDTAIYIAALHNIKHRKNRIKSLKELKRVMKKKGTAMISVWSREQEKFRDLFENINKKNQEIGDIEIKWRQENLDVTRFYHLYSEEEFKEDLKKAGLQIKEFIPKKLVSKKYFDNYFAIVKK